MKVWVHFLDNQRYWIKPSSGSKIGLDDVVQIEIYCHQRFLYSEIEDDFYGGCEYDSRNFVKLLKEFARKMEKITLNLSRAAECPESLELLISTFNQVDSLKIVDLAGDAGYSCLKSCLLQHDGPRELLLDIVRAVTANQATLLFEGLASSSILESFALFSSGGFMVFLDVEEASRSFVDALRRNQSLTCLQFESSQFYPDHYNMANIDPANRILPNICQAAILDTKVRCLNIRQPAHSDREELCFDFLVETLCQKDCVLRALHLETISFQPKCNSSFANVALEDILPNSSVTEFSICKSFLDSSRIMETVSLLKSLVSLNLQGNRFSTLSHLDPLLFGKNLTLQNLVLTDNQIEEEEAVNFFRKLPQMTCLRHLSISTNPFCWTNSYLDVLGDVVWRNKSLEGLCFETDDACPHLTALYTHISIPLSLNRAGRRALELELPLQKAIAPNLLPLILERATKLFYYNYDDGWHYPTSKTARADAIFWLLQKEVFGKCLA